MTCMSTADEYLDDELTERYYGRGLTPPGMTPMPTVLAGLKPPF